MIRKMALPVMLGLLALVALWAFVSYLHPAFSGEVGDLLFCN
ncbi:MAG TPA: hypothetical protein VFM45_05910 [Anaeromyxobacteraceae bacterium]|nr:hypothetical protein [Anaeromyxobacteraceae bacterium]